MSSGEIVCPQTRRYFGRGHGSGKMNELNAGDYRNRAQERLLLMYKLE